MYMFSPMLRSLYDSILKCPPYGWFPSTPELAKMMLQQIKIQSGIIALEPSAGSGVLAQAMRQRGAVVDVVELDFRFQALLFQQGFKVVGSDFLSTKATQLYDLILMNPPFSASFEQRGVDLAHIRYAYGEFLAPGGQLVSVVSNSMNCKNCPRAQQFRRFLKRIDATLLELPLEIFWGSDRPVTVESRLVVAHKG
ncbi:methyltransferase [Phormidesmis sp. 146-12]